MSKNIFNAILPILFVVTFVIGVSVVVMLAKYGNEASERNAEAYKQEVEAFMSQCHNDGYKLTDCKVMLHEHYGIHKY